MTAMTVPLRAPDADAFAPFGSFVLPPDAPGKRRFYSDALHAQSPQSGPVLHVNHVLPKSLPIEVTGIERHPHAAQCFFPLDVSRYAVLVMPSDAAGDPVIEQALAFLLPGTMG
ncbi:MAG: ureidoglycolate lyase, partial [Pseudomonadota bacterium]